MFKHLAGTQGSDGVGREGTSAYFTTATHLTILQLENGTLPIYQR